MSFACSQPKLVEFGLLILVGLSLEAGCDLLWLGEVLEIFLVRAGCNFSVTGELSLTLLGMLEVVWFGFGFGLEFGL